MAVSAIKWEASWTDRGTVLTTELNSITAGSRSAAGTALDNGTNLDQYAVGYISITFGSSPAAGGSLDLHCLPSYDGTNYVDGGASVNPGAHTIVATVEVSVQTGQKKVTPPFLLPPGKCKFLLTNRTSQSTPASGSTVNIFTFNDESQ